MSGQRKDEGCRSREAARKPLAKLPSVAFIALVAAACSPGVSPAAPPTPCAAEPRGALAPAHAALTDAGASTPTAVVPSTPWTPTPPGATTFVFRDLYVGALPFPSRRRTWTLILGEQTAVLRVESETAKESFAAIGPENQWSERWSLVMRAEYTGEVASALKLTLRFGGDDSTRLAQAFTLACTTAAIRVHPANATLVRGWRYPDDSGAEAASWAPPRTDLVSDVKLCTASPGGRHDGPLFPFTTAFAFVQRRKLPRNEFARGVEWSFVNSDESIQEGGYRWIPESAPSRP